VMACKHIGIKSTFKRRERETRIGKGGRRDRCPASVLEEAYPGRHGVGIDRIKRARRSRRSSVSVPSPEQYPGPAQPKTRSTASRAGRGRSFPGCRRTGDTAYRARALRSTVRRPGAADAGVVVHLGEHLQGRPADTKFIDSPRAPSRAVPSGPAVTRVVRHLRRIRGHPVARRTNRVVALGTRPRRRMPDPDQLIVARPAELVRCGVGEEPGRFRRRRRTWFAVVAGPEQGVVGRRTQTSRSPASTHVRPPGPVRGEPRFRPGTAAW
jgi:hypothetical protein